MDSINSQEHICFQELKKRVRQEVESQLQIRKELKAWSGRDIQTFQIDLEAKCKSSVSEKWIYLHFKNENEKLPRVDVLNLLSEYCGYKDWDDFRFQHIPPKSVSNGKMGRLIIAILSLGIISAGVWFLFKSSSVVLTFRDAYTHAWINANELKVEGHGIKKMQGNYVHVKSPNEMKMTVDGPYYKMKDFVVSNNIDTMIIDLFPDDYALMLNYFSRSKVEDWEKRRDQLDEAIHDEAKLFQVHPDYNGIELLNKQEFIDRLILPVNSLKNLEIQHIIYKDGQIYRLRFVQKQEDHE